MTGEVVRQARQSRGLSQRELAHASGISQPNISAIESGRRQPSADTFVQLLAGCGYELVAIAGARKIRLPFPLEDAPGDVPTEPPTPVEARADEMIGHDKELLPFLSAEDICLFKLSFGRPKDWIDLAEIAAAQPRLDVDYIEDQLVGLRGPTMYPRMTRFRRLLPLP